jgi:hypothetical protein
MNSGKEENRCYKFEFGRHYACDVSTQGVWAICYILERVVTFEIVEGKMRSCNPETNRNGNTLICVTKKRSCFIFILSQR